MTETLKRGFCFGREEASTASLAQFVTCFACREVEAAFEATTGWRFVVEELRAIGADVPLAEPAETAARRGNKTRAKTVPTPPDAPLINTLCPGCTLP